MARSEMYRSESIDKTSAAKVILGQAGYDVIELNASDTRSEKALKAAAGSSVALKL